jgi:K+-transporting ATPase ATPase C chain
MGRKMKTIVISLKIFLFLTILTGIIYPLFVTLVAQVVFPTKANGSLIELENQPVGSKFIGQQFDSAKYFTSRPSAISYNPLPSGGSNYGLTNIKLKNMVTERKTRFITYNQLDSLTIIPSEMLFASGSGLDPHISQEAALLQVERVAKARNFNTTQKQNLVQSIIKLTETTQFLVLGEERVNVLLLNLEINKPNKNNTNN